MTVEVMFRSTPTDIDHTTASHLNSDRNDYLVKRSLGLKAFAPEVRTPRKTSLFKSGSRSQVRTALSSVDQHQTAYKRIEEDLSILSGARREQDSNLYPYLRFATTFSCYPLSWQDSNGTGRDEMCRDEAPNIISGTSVLA